jgi:beta-lactamase regulating signal transducer with metallopeptidase domain
MSSALLTILEISTVASSCGILAVFLLRMPLRAGFGPALAYFLWVLVPTSLLVLLLPAPNTALKVAIPVALSMAYMTGATHVSGSSGFDWVTWSTWLWGAGALLLASRLARQQQQFIANLGDLKMEDGVFRAASSRGCPAVLGVADPRIVVPIDFATRYTTVEQTLILAHESMHVRRGDLIINALWVIGRCIYWFNPLIHIAARAMRFDQELACDAAVIREHPHSRKPYANAMLATQLAEAALPLGCHWPSTHPLKRRILFLTQKPAEGLRRRMGQVLIGGCVMLIGYGTWAVQSEVPSEGGKTRVKFDDSAIRISADKAESSGDTVRYTGNVVVEVLSGNKGRVELDAKKASALSGDIVAEGNLKIDEKPTSHATVDRQMRKLMLLEGVQFKVDGRTFTTDRAIYTGYRPSASANLRMDAVEVRRETSGDAH